MQDPISVPALRPLAVSHPCHTLGWDCTSTSCLWKAPTTSSRQVPAWKVEQRCSEIISLAPWHYVSGLRPRYISVLVDLKCHFLFQGHKLKLFRKHTIITGSSSLKPLLYQSLIPALAFFLAYGFWWHKQWIRCWVSDAVMLSWQQHPGDIKGMHLPWRW